MTIIRATFLLFMHLSAVASLFWHNSNDTRSLAATTKFAEYLKPTEDTSFDMDDTDADDDIVSSEAAEEVIYPEDKQAGNQVSPVGIVFIVLPCVLLLGLGGFIYVRRKRIHNAGNARVVLTMRAKQNAGVYQETTSSENILFLIPLKQSPGEYRDLYESDSSVDI